MTYCQHAHKLRLNMGPGITDVVSERPRHKRTGEFLDGLAGTQIAVPDGVLGFDVAFALRVGQLAELPCADHPGEEVKRGKNSKPSI